MRQFHRKGGWTRPGRPTPSIALVLLVACHHKAETCDPADPAACDDGLVCEQVVGGEPTCFPPVLLTGKVFSLADGAGIGGARVVAINANGAPTTGVAVSDASGAYELAVSSPRDEDGAPTVPHLTLRADAAGYLTYPSGVRIAIPVDTANPAPGEQDDDPWTVHNATTDIGLVDSPPGTGTGSIAGNAQVPPDHVGVLVVAEGVGTGGATAIADTNGDYVIFNLADGNWTVTGYAQGHAYGPVTTTVSAGGTANADLVLTTEGTGTATGSVQIVNAPGGSVTSVILVVESTFDETLARGETPPGLRAGDVTGDWTIDGVPPGKYAVLAAFENDGLVRDPDTAISGTDIVHLVVGSGQTSDVSGFKVTEALSVIGPGADTAEAVSGPPTLSWADDSSEDEYDLVVYDAYGNEAWTATEPGHSGDDPAVPYGGPLDAGMYYWFRATSLKKGVPISQTEDLRGVFYSQ